MRSESTNKRLWQRKALLTVLFVGLGLMAVADDYMPFVQEGKRWEFKEPDGLEYSYVISGDTIIGEHHYKKVYLINDEGRTYQTAVREENRVVYAQHPKWEREEIICFFTTFGQEKYEYKEDYSTGLSIVYQVSGYKPVKASTGRIHQVFSCSYSLIGQDKFIMDGFLWYEGVGELSTNSHLFSLSGLYSSSFIGFVACYLDDKVILSFDDLGNFVHNYQNVTAPSLAKQVGSSLYDLQGRQLSNSQWSNSQMRKGVYIQDGRKVVR